MKARKYTIEVCDSVLDQIHGQSYKISEVYIEDLGLYINTKGAFLAQLRNFLENDDPNLRRVPKDAEEIELDQEDAKEATRLVEALRVKKETETRLRNYLFGEKVSDVGQ